MNQLLLIAAEAKVKVNDVSHTSMCKSETFSVRSLILYLESFSSNAKSDFSFINSTNLSSIDAFYKRVSQS